ncbi:MAG TPA: fibrobacter succinogenes major paralogous domain-containing protein [Bacteroidia bacterium]|nr:fibrobacter succinogenes major paralogous domain-containing protein [Bacteroidia bacterium]
MNLAHIINKQKGVYFTIGIILFLSVFSSCKKKEVSEPSIETGTVTDVDGNVYKTVKIGDQWWMAENLKTTSYQDGSPINLITKDQDTKWKNDSIGAYTNNAFLYNGYAIFNPKNIAPEGWHIPSDEEWKELERNMGMAADETDKTSWRGTNEGEKLMKERDETGLLYWVAYGDVWATNEKGFAALPFGCRFFDGSNGDGVAKQTGFWWSSTKHGNEIWYRYLDYKNKNIFRYHGPQGYGFSVRCVKNK